MKNVLLVEDSQTFGKVTKKKIESFFDVPVYWTKTMADTKKLLSMDKAEFSCALLDYHLPDAPDGEVIDLVLSRGITTFVFTTDTKEGIWDKVWTKKIADYILKEDPNSMDYILSAIGQLEKNQNTLILVVDDSKTARTRFSELLYIRQYKVINARDGEEALRILDKYPQIKLVITDYNMPKMNGFKLCQQIRLKYKADRIAIIGISSEEDRSIGAKFMKNGANDFIVKQSFLVEEFYSRVADCLRTIDLFDRLRAAATTDFLTKLYNRRQFFKEGKRLFASKKKNSGSLTCTLIDIDFFKQINDTHGHDIGDQALVGVAEILMKNHRQGEITARIGGEEFCILTPDLGLSEMIERIEKLRQAIEKTPVAILPDGSPLHVTASFGICAELKKSIGSMLKAADRNLYRAKQAGRNRIIFQAAATSANGQQSRR